MNQYLKKIKPISSSISGRGCGTYHNSRLKTMLLVTVVDSNGWADVEQGSVVLVRSEDCIFVEEHGGHEDDIGEFIFLPVSKGLGVRKA